MGHYIVEMYNSKQLHNQYLGIDQFYINLQSIIWEFQGIITKEDKQIF